MAGSMGSVMMTWTTELIKQAKKKNRRKMKEKFRQENTETSILSTKESNEKRILEPSYGKPCQDCAVNLERITSLEEDLEEISLEQADVKAKLETSKASLSESMSKESVLRNEKERLELEEAQLKYELEQLNKKLLEQQRVHEQENEKQDKLMEQLLQAKDQEYQAKIEHLETELHNAFHSHVYNTNVAHMSRAQLEQEISSLHTVIEMRNGELQSVRRINQELHERVERLNFVENELAKTRQRLEEMNLVVQNKMVAEKELLDMTESLTDDLANARNEIVRLKKEIENRTYLHQYNNNCFNDGQEKSDPEKKVHRNEHQKASCGGNGCTRKSDPSLVVNVVEKSEAVAWMLHMPDSPKLASK